MDFDKTLKSQEIVAKAKLDSGMDVGHNRLLEDLINLLAAVRVLEFHDFLNTTHATPKITLVQQLEGLIQNTKEGRYDN